MKFKLKSIISVTVIAAFSAAIVATASASAANGTADNVAEEQISSENVITPFEIALLEGRRPHDPNCFNTANGLPCIGENNDKLAPDTDRYLTNALLDDVEIKLEKIYDRSEEGNTYTLWSGRFTTSNVSAFSAEFSEPDTFTCRTSNKTGMISGKKGFLGNYKEVKVSLTYLENGKKVVKGSSNEGTATTVSSTASYTGSGKLVEAAYYFYVRSGTESNSPYYDIAVVHVVDSDYANSALYAENSYADLIEYYTYVDPDEIGMELPLE